MPRALKPAFVAGALALALLAAACGGGSHAAISVKVAITTFVPPKMHRSTTTFTLTCHPTGGTFPYAARLCRDIARHPQPLLDPLPARYGCSGNPFMAVVTVTTRASGHSTTFSGNPDCTWPGGVGLAVYYDAATRRPEWFAPTEKRLRCDDDPALLVTPRPEVSVFACTHNLWTPRTAKLIRIAKRSQVIRSLGPNLFPNQIGDPQCTIHGGGPAPGTTFRGLCEVTVKKVWSTPTVTFVESWPVGGRMWHSRLVLLIRGGHVVSVHLSGSYPPQLWS
jgi:hypothetical protein